MNTTSGIETYSRRQGRIVRDETHTFRFPAGELHMAPESPGDGVCVLVRGTRAEDYVEAALWVDAQRHAGAEHLTLAVPYLPAARADRGTPFGAGVYAKLLDLVGADRVLALDPHSAVMPGLIANFEAYPAWRLVRHALARRVADGWTSDYAGVIAPDAGARDRAAATAHALGVPVLQGLKHRDFATGKLSGFTVEELPETGRLLVVDDICDGGGTFRGLADATGLPPERLDLWVTHGVFSGRADELRTRFGAIHTTDSLPSAHRAEVGATVHPITQTLILEALR